MRGRPARIIWILLFPALLFVPGSVRGLSQTVSSNGLEANKRSEHAFSRLSPIPPKRIKELFGQVTTSAVDIVTSGSVPMYARPSSTHSIAVLDAGDMVHRVRRDGGWSVVRTRDGRIGYIRSGALSNKWVLVAKQKQKVYVYEEETLVAGFDVDLAVNPEGDKEHRGSVLNPEQRRTPEGLFFISKLNPNSKFHKALVLNYPTPRHAERGLRNGIISRHQYAEIVKAAMTFRSPPMNTRLGGWIEFHGLGVKGKANWTDGCIALGNADMDRLYDLVGVGTPVLIVP